VNGPTSAGTARATFLARALGTSVPKAPRPLALLAVFLLAFVVRSLYAVDLAPLMHRPQQPGTRMTARYDEAALGILSGEGVLYPVAPDPARTGLLARPPGYALYLAAVYRLLGHDLFAAQLVQNALTSLCCVLAAWAAARLVSARVGLLAGVLAGLSPQLGFASNLVLPDALSALPLLGSLLLLTAAHPDRRGGWAWSAGAGGLIGAGCWLRPNVVLLPGLLGVLILLVSRDRRRALGHAVALGVASVLVVIPITLRNWSIFHAFVPISTNGGLTFWQGAADAGGKAAGAFKRDKLVMLEEAERYGKPEYAQWWAEPDGIWRDGERYRRGWEVIRGNPGRYARLMLRRMAGMLRYDDGFAPRVARPGEVLSLPVDEEGGPSAPADVDERLRHGERFRIGRAFSALRLPLRALQTALLPISMPLVLLGIVVLIAVQARHAALLLSLPLYYLLTESFFILEWRVVVPMHYGLFAAAAAALLVLFHAAATLAARLKPRTAPGA
jgi:4-amino-4-deoxy-L-arabinose transferase-like glycosyltransferase